MTPKSVENTTDLQQNALTNIIFCYRGHLSNSEHITNENYDITKVTAKGEITGLHTTYQISIDGSFRFVNAYDYCADDVECKFSEEKIAEFFDSINKCNLKEYEVYHANADGVMVTEYPEFYIYNIDTDKTFELSESDYNTILTQANKLKIIAESNSKE